MKLRNINYLLFCLASFVFASCVKNNVTELKDQGSTFIKLLEAPENKLFFEPFTGSRNVALTSVRRDANSEASLNQAVTVTLRVDTAAIRAYNTANNETFALLPDSLFTLGSGITKTGNLTYQMTFQPGGFAKDFMIALNGSKWDLSKKYAMPFVIENSGGLKISADQNRVLTMISVKNKWDGVYSVTGSLTDLVNPALTGLYPLKWDLVTSGPNQLIVVDKEYLGAPAHIISNGGTPTYYGSFGLVVNLDPVTNKITSITNYYGQPAGNGRSAGLDPTGVNAYDPATKTFQVKYFMYQPGTTVRTSFDETWKFVGPR